MGRSRFKLRFEPELEAEFQNYIYEEAKAGWSKLLKFLGPVSVIGWSLHWLVIGLDTIPRAVVITEIGLSVMLGVFYFVIKKFPQIVKKRPFIVPLSVFSMFTALLFAIFVFGREDRRPFAVGYPYIMILCSMGMPFAFDAKLIASKLIIVSFAIICWRLDLYRPDILAVVGLQLTIAMFIATMLSYQADRRRRREFLLSRQVAEEKRRADELLYNVLPEKVAQKLIENPTSKPPVERHMVTILFADIVGFTEMSARLKPEEVVSTLNDIFGRFDAIAARLSVEKIKTIGDAYMAVAGVPSPVEDHAGQIAELALEMREAIKRYSHISGNNLAVRIGINSGPVVAGIIGSHRFLYDLWGDAVNVASRMESHGIAGSIQISEETRRLLGDRYEFESRGEINVKGRGIMNTYLLIKPRLRITA